MVNLKKYCIVGALLVGGLMGSHALSIAQGPPVSLETCNVSGIQNFKELPVPGKFVPGENEALRNCPNLGNCIVEIAQAKAGKATGLVMHLQIEAGVLVRSSCKATGDKSFQKLYKQVNGQAGRATKMVVSKGKKSYSWEMSTKLPCKIAMIYDPASQVGEVILEQFGRK